MGRSCSKYGDIEVFTGFLVGKRREREYSEDPAVDVSVILSRIFMKWDGEHGLD